MARSYSADQYRQLLKSLLPRGVLWVAHDGGIIDSLLAAFGIELNRVDVRGFDLREEVDPRTTSELLDEHDTDLGLPEPAFLNPANDEVQRQRIEDRYTMRTDSPSAPYYEELATDYNYLIDIQEFSPYLSAQATEAALGNPFGPFNPGFSNYQLPADFISWDDPGTPLVDDKDSSWFIDFADDGSAFIDSTDATRRSTIRLHAGVGNDSVFAAVVEDANGVQVGGYIRAAQTESTTELLTNGSLDAGWPAPTGWSITGTDANRTITEEAVQVVSGSAAKLNATAIGADHMDIRQTVSGIIPGAYYRPQAWRFVSALTGDVALFAISSYDNISASTPELAYQLLTLRFNGVAANTNVNLSLTLDINGIGTVYWDAATLPRIDESNGVEIYDSTSGGNQLWDRREGGFDPSAGDLTVRIYQL